MSDVLVKTVFFNASREAVWSYLTEKDKLAKWFHVPKFDLVDGEEYELFGKSEGGEAPRLCWGKVLEMDKPSKMVWSFSIKPFPGVETRVIWNLDEVSGGTRLTLRHEGIATAAAENALSILIALDGGWDRHFGSLRENLNS